MFKKTVLAASLAVGLGVGLSAQASTGVRWDLTGASGLGVLVDNITWTNTYVSCVGCMAPGGQGTLVGFGSISSMSHEGGVIGGVPIRYSYQFSIPVIVGLGGTAPEAILSFDTAAIGAATLYGPSNFFNIYYDTSPSYSQDAGSGFGLSGGEVNAGQSLILSGKVVMRTDASGNSLSSFEIPNILAAQVPISNTGAGGITTVTGSGSVNFDINVCDLLNPIDAAAAECSQLAASSTVDAAFFRSPVDTLQVDVDLGGQLETPWVNRPVPDRFLNVPFNLGTGNNRNDLDCEGAAGSCDMIFGARAAESRVFAPQIPEPGSLALLGLGLGALGVMSRRRKSA